MPKRLRGYRRYKKRYYRYKYNKYTHRRQKLTLTSVNRKLNKYIYNTRPEWTQLRGICFDIYNRNGDGGSLTATGCGGYSFYYDILNVYNIPGEGRRPRSLIINNEFLRSYKLVLTGGFSLCPTNNVYESERINDGTVQQPLYRYNYKEKKPYPSDVYIRLVVVKYIKERSEALHCANLYDNTSGVGEPDGIQDIAEISGPLKKGITGAVKILKTKVIKLSLMRPSKLFKMSIRLPHYRTVINENSEIGAGEIGIFYNYLVPTYLGNSNSTMSTPEFVSRLNYQFVYVDQN